MVLFHMRVSLFSLTYTFFLSAILSSACSPTRVATTNEMAAAEDESSNYPFADYFGVNAPKVGYHDLAGCFMLVNDSGRYQNVAPHASCTGFQNGALRRTRTYSLYRRTYYAEHGEFRGDLLWSITFGTSFKRWRVKENERLPTPT